MHDGQNLFDAATSYSGEWEVDETLNKLAAQGKKVPIVVGIDNGGGDRIGEYTPWANSQYGGGDGEKYMQFIVETLKPYIDQHYRTLPDRENTGILGSSLGGLISHYGSLRYQGTFSKVGLFSPSYWFSDNIWAFTHSIGLGQNLRFFQLCGTGEGAGVQSDMQRMNDSLVSMGFGQDNIFNKIVSIVYKDNNKKCNFSFVNQLWKTTPHQAKFKDLANKKEVYKDTDVKTLNEYQE